MNSKELVRRTMKGDPQSKTPLYGWVVENLKDQISERFGSVKNFEDKYQFDMAHIFGGPKCYGKELQQLIDSGEEVTPEVLLSINMAPTDNMEDYENVKAELAHHNARERFCYIQSNGIFEALNDPFGIENHLLYLALYPDELKEVYKRQAEWNKKVSLNMIELGVDGIHVSDDWGAQKSLMFSYNMFRDMIFPFHKDMADSVRKNSDVLLSLHSDGCIVPALDSIVEIGYDFIHPWQENAGMPYSLYLDKYQDKFGTLGGICIQSTLGFNDYDRLKSEITRVFGTLKGKRWACCTSHYVQNHCSVDELVFAYDLAFKLANK